MKLTDRLKTLGNPTTAGNGKDAAKLRSEGDTLRDAGQYAKAAEAYDTYLALKPDDFDIWVQRGNCLKDCGAFTDAKLAYDSALRLRPNDADVHLQVGHLMKLQGLRAEAIKAYQRSLELDSSGGAGAELKALGVKWKVDGSPLKSPALANRPVTLLDITDLLTFLGVHHRVTGIQRVQSCIIHHLLNTLSRVHGFGKTPQEGDTLFTLFDHKTQRLSVLSPKAIDQLIDGLLWQDLEHDDVRALVKRVVDSSVPIEARAIDTYVILGAFWIVPNYVALLRRLKKTGTKVGVYVYDLIPITHPQHVMDSTRRELQDKFSDVMYLADFAMTISSFVAGEVSELVQRELGFQFPVAPVVLAHELIERADEAEPSEDFKRSLPREYVLCVCTIESRKNHALLLNVWSSLKRKYGSKLPSLVLVGRWGWRVDELRKRLEAEDFLDGKIVVLGNLSESELKFAYENCLLTVFPSFVEGWGLPVGESLARGKPCIASNASSLPEVGGDFVRYISPHDELAATAEIERAIVDREDLRRWTERIQREFQPRSWESVAQTFMKTVSELSRRVSVSRPAAPRLEAGKLHRLTQKDFLQPNASWRERLVKLVAAEGWWEFEDWGAWSCRRVAELEFATGLPPKTPIRVLLGLRLPPPAERGTIVVHGDGDDVTRIPFESADAKWAFVESATDETGVVRLRVERTGDVQQVEQARELYCGLHALAYHSRTDMAARMDILEAVLLQAR